MATLVKSVTSKDAKGFYTTENTYEAFDGPIAATGDARSWSQSISDGKYTLVETFQDEIPDPENPGQNYFPDTWTMEISTSSEPIETHPHFAPVQDYQWSQVRLWKNGNPSPPDWTPSTAGGTLVKYQSLIDKGTTTYLAPRIVIKHVYVSSTLPTLSKVGKISWPGGPLVTQSPTGVDYILTGASVVSEGGNYKISLEWLGSALYGWDPVLYYASTQ
jgi:hypothetical protein